MMMTITTSSCICDDPHLSNLYWYRCPIHSREGSFPWAHDYNAQQHDHSRKPHQPLIDGGNGSSGGGADDDSLKHWPEDLTAGMLSWMVRERYHHGIGPLGNKHDEDDNDDAGGGGHDDEMDYERLTSFLRHDNSFFTPWNWKPCDAEKRDEEDDDESSVGGSSMNEAHHDINSSNGPKPGEFMQFQPGSFSYYSDKQVGSDFMGSCEL